MVKNGQTLKKDLYLSFSFIIVQFKNVEMTFINYNFINS